MFVEARVLGRSDAGIEPRQVDFAPSGAVPLRELIAHAVRHEVGAFTERERQRRFVRVLTARQIDDGVRAGKIDPDSHTPSEPVDADAAVATAVEAFGDGFYFVFVDGRQRDDLDELVEVTETTTVRFVRLVPLAGG